MELNLKIQNILDQDPNNKRQISLTHFFDVEDPVLSQKRGKLFIVISLQNTGDFEAQPALKIFLDNIRDNYYRNNEETPLNALEKALNKAYQMLLALKNEGAQSSLHEDNNSIEPGFKISFCTALIWNKVLYVSYIGNPAAYLIRGSGVRNIAAAQASYDEIWTSSSILDLEDVVIIGTEDFAETFPPKDIISALNEIPQIINESPNKNLLAATLIKIAGSTGKEKSNKSTFLGNLYIKGSLPDKFAKVKDSVYKVPRLSEKFNIYQKKKTAPVSSISGLVPSNQGQERASIETAKRLSSRRRNLRPLKFGVGLTAIAALSYLGYYIINNKPVNDIPINTEVTKVIQETGKDENQVPTAEAKDLFPILFEPKDTRINGLSARGSEVILFDKNKRGLYEFNPQSQEVKNPLNNLENFEYLKCDNKLCYIYANKTLNVIDPKTPDKIDRYLLEDVSGVVDIYPYLNKIYLLTSTNIYSIALQGETATPWLKSETLQLPTSFAVDNNIYVLRGKSIDKYYGGAKMGSFDLSADLKNPIQMDMDVKNIYILDKDTHEIVVFDKTKMALVKHIKLAEDFDPEEPARFSLINTTTSKEDLIFEKGNKVYKVVL